VRISGGAIAESGNSSDRMRVYRSILVPLDGSGLAERALGVAAALAARMHSDLHLVHVHRERVVDELPTYGLTGEAARAAAEQYVLAAADRLRAEQGGSVSGAVLEGSAAGSIVAHATAAGTDLIVMSSHGRTGASRFWLGSVADAVIRSTTVPVLMVRGDGDTTATTNAGMFERVLVPLDGSSVAEAVVPHAIALAKLNEAHVHLLQIEERAEDLRTSVWGLAAHEPDDLPARLERADRYLHGVVARFESDWAPATVGAEARGAHRIGEAIAQVATERDIDLIAMATHGRGASRLLIGSVADKVIRGTACAILLYRMR
jgi:nucleotide-binding universal stress UspA family protein